MVTEQEAAMEMVLPLLVTDVMQKLEDLGEHPEEDFTERLRIALLKIVPQYPKIQQDIWDQQKKEELVEKVCEVIEL